MILTCFHTMLLAYVIVGFMLAFSLCILSFYVFLYL